jgi:hypothetical protein
MLLMLLMLFGDAPQLGRMRKVVLVLVLSMGSNIHLSHGTEYQVRSTPCANTEYLGSTNRLEMGPVGIWHRIGFAHQTTGEIGTRTSAGSSIRTSMRQRRAPILRSM